jgi:hypothetical protein
MNIIDPKNNEITPNPGLGNTIAIFKTTVEEVE